MFCSETIIWYSLNAIRGFSLWNFNCCAGGIPVDPNEKQVSPMNFVTVNTVLSNRLYFENIGTAPATDVYVRDTLSPRLDDHTLRDISNGGTYDPGTRTISWALKDINLQPGETKYVSFRIMPSVYTPRGTFIYNKATIVFDTQPPMDTPTVPIYVGPPPEWNALTLLEQVRMFLTQMKQNVQDPSFVLKNKGSLLGKLDAMLISVSNAIVNVNAGKTNLTGNNIYTCINEMNALINFGSSQVGKEMSPEMWAQGIVQFRQLIFMLETAKTLL